jgi:hypothetical protein
MGDMSDDEANTPDEIDHEEELRRLVTSYSGVNHHDLSEVEGHTYWQYTVKVDVHSTDVDLDELARHLSPLAKLSARYELRVGSDRISLLLEEMTQTVRACGGIAWRYQWEEEVGSDDIREILNPRLLIRVAGSTYVHPVQYGAVAVRDGVACFDRLKTKPTDEAF